MTRRILYQPPDGEGPSVVAECTGCPHYFTWTCHGTNGCYHCNSLGKSFDGPVTPSWCPILAERREVYERLINGNP